MSDTCACDACDSTGIIQGRLCEACRGTGRIVLVGGK